jgi:DNA-binding response OmpR family regulator
VDGAFVDENTLSVNIRRLRNKIEDDPKQPAYVKTVFGIGYTWGE